MKKHFSFLIILLGIFIIPNRSSYCQKTADKAQYASLLLSKGIIISEESCKSLNEYDFQLLSDFDFNSYRNESTDRSVKIKRGPSIELKSIDFMLKNGHQVDKQIINMKKNESTTSVNHSLMTVIDIGAGYRPVNESEKWVTE